MSLQRPRLRLRLIRLSLTGAGGTAPGRENLDLYGGCNRIVWCSVSGTWRPWVVRLFAEARLSANLRDGIASGARAASTRRRSAPH